MQCEEVECLRVSRDQSADGSVHFQSRHNFCPTSVEIDLREAMFSLQWGKPKAVCLCLLRDFCCSRVLGQ